MTTGKLLHLSESQLPRRNPSDWGSVLGAQGSRGELRSLSVLPQSTRDAGDRDPFSWSWLSWSSQSCGPSFSASCFPRVSDWMMGDGKCTAPPSRPRPAPRAPRPAENIDVFCAPGLTSQIGSLCLDLSASTHMCEPVRLCLCLSAHAARPSAPFCAPHDPGARTPRGRGESFRVLLSPQRPPSAGRCLATKTC